MASTAPASSAPHAWILDLPTELLQKIADECSEETVLQLRQTCKTWEGATLELFAEDYLQHLVCFMLDPARLLRVKNIMSAPHLAARVRSVSFTLSAHEDQYDIQFAPNDGEYLGQTKGNATDAAALEQYDRHECEIEFISPDCWKLMRDIMALTTEVSTCSITIDMVGEDSVRPRLTANHPLLAKELLSVVVQEGVRLRGIILTDGCHLHAAHFAHDGIFREALQNLRSFAYFMHPKTEADLLDKRVSHHWRILSTVVRDAKCLEVLQMDLKNGYEAVDYGSVLSELCAQAFADSHLPCLQELNLEGMNVSIDTLVELIESCAETVDTVTVGACALVGDDDPSGRLLRSLSALPHLATITMYNIVARAKDQTQFEEDGFHRTLFLLPGESIEHRFEETPDREAIEAQHFLELNLKHGVQYT